ncbi:MAG: TonB-dependent receptor [Candidatus Eremiobacteraeota bacterium]|nr:TonB-dependent receptor [Candidatus Eremiobacteraeota bacterium]
MWLLLVCVLAAPAAAAESARIVVRVTVVDSVSRRPVAHAHVRLLSDARQYDGFSGADGVVEFTGVVSANYGVRVDADGYSFGHDADVTASGAPAQSLTVTGVRTKLSRIGAVATRSRPAPNLAQGTRETDPSAIIAGGVGGSLDTIPAIGRNAADGSLLIHNHDASTTAATLNGAPIFPSGTKNQLGLLNSDIFSSASLGTGAVAGAPNGSLDTRTYDPTIDWIGMIQERAASFGSSALTLQERGTAGRVGFSAVHAQAELGHPLDGRYYADTTGLAYNHHANSLSSGDTFTTRYGFDANHVAFLSLGSVTTTTPLICTEDSGPLPCGYGTGNRTAQRVGYAQLRDMLTLDRASLEFQVYQSRSRSSQLFDTKLSAGTAAGFENTTMTDRRGYLAKFGLLYARSRVAHLSVSGYRDVTQNGGSFVASTFPPPIASSVLSIAADLPVIASRNLTVTAGAGRDTSGGSSHGTFDVRTTYQLTNRDGLSASFATGHLGTRQASFSGIGLPADLTFDCNGGAAIGDGPLIAPGSISATTQLRAGLNHSGARISANVDAYREVSRNASVSAIVPAGALSGSLFAGTYLPAASQAGASNCGRPFPVTAANLFYRVSSPVDRIVNDGFDSSAQFDIGRAVRLEVAYSLSRARAFGSGFPFVAGSDLAAGSQIPLRPLHREEAKLTYALSRATSLFGLAHYDGSNNTYRARPLTTLDLAARFSSFTGDLTVAVQNVTNADAGPFARFDPFPTLATPAAPRTISVRYRLTLGKQGIDRAALLSAPFSQQGGFMFVPQPFESVARTDWLAPDKEGFLCGAEQLPQAKEYADAIRAYDARIQEALRADSQRKDFPGTSFGALDLSFVRNASGYAIRIKVRPGQGRKISPFMRCTRVHTGTYDEAQRLRLYAPTWQEHEAQGFGFFYSPQAGIYFAPQGADATRTSEVEFRMGLPARAPANPFAIDEAACPATYRPGVQDALRTLKNYITAVYAGGHPTTPEGFSITKHAAKSEPWLELIADDRAFGEALFNCVHAPAIDLKDLAGRGLSGANFPSFDYAPSLGFYRATSMLQIKK